MKIINKILDGKAVSQQIKAEITEIVSKLSSPPKLSVILVGNNFASSVYVKNKSQACIVCGIQSEVITLDENISEAELLKKIHELNQDNHTHGILVQLPLPKQIREDRIIENIDPRKDVDGFHPLNVGHLFLKKAMLEPCTPVGVIEILKRYALPIAGKHVVIIGRSNIVGKPLGIMFLRENATVTYCHSKTRDLPSVAQTADILIAAIGKAQFVTDEFVKTNAVIIDVGINRLPNGKLAGDVDFEKVSPKVSAITPVPGGVGPMTIAILLKNTLKAYQNIMHKK